MRTAVVTTVIATTAAKMMRIVKLKTKSFRLLTISSRMSNTQASQRIVFFLSSNWMLYLLDIVFGSNLGCLNGMITTHRPVHAMQPLS